jgi:hypothetical protein
MCAISLCDRRLFQWAHERGDIRPEAGRYNNQQS